MTKKYLYNSIYFLLFVLFIFATYLSYIGGYGSDEDTLPMIGTFQAILNHGTIMTSRFTGYPVAEFGIGFLSHNFGSFVANFVTFALLFISLIFIFLTFNLDDKERKNLLPIFLLLCLSNPTIFFDNLEPIDYSWSLAPFAIGCYFYKKRIYDLSILFFCLCIGARLNFALFVIFFIIFFDNGDNLKFQKKLIYLFCVLFFGSLFYLPTWYTHKFGFDWVTAARPIEQGLYGLFGRFFYKIINLYTIFSFILILVFFTNKKVIFNFLKNKSILFIFLSNLLLFLWIPAELSYLLLGLIIFYFFLIKNLSIQKIFLIILLNFSSWFLQIDFLEIKYKDKIEVCSAPNAIDAEFKLSIKDGSIIRYLNTRSKIMCWLDSYDPIRIEKIINGEALK